MSAEDDRKATQTVLNVLTWRAISKLKFTIGKITVSPELYEKVKKAIETKKVTVLVQSLAPGVAAKYFSTMKIRDDMIFYDVMVLTTAELTGTIAEQISRAQYLVHECTHAGFDLLSQKMTRLENEALAYVAAAMFVQLAMKENRGDPTKVPTSGMTKIEQAAWDIASKEIGGGTVTKDMYNALNVAIEAEPEYKDAGKKPSENDGVGREWKLPKPAAPPPTPPASAPRASDQSPRR